jgi:hypothetical protein
MAVLNGAAYVEQSVARLPVAVEADPQAVTIRQERRGKLIGLPNRTARESSELDRKERIDRERSYDEGTVHKTQSFSQIASGSVRDTFESQVWITTRSSFPKSESSF